MSKRIIITGGPGFGKTSIIQNLASKGYKTSHEKAREVIKQQVALQSNKLPWLDVKGFSDLVVGAILKEDCFDADLVFFDRGVPDVMAYLKNASLSYSHLHYLQALKKMNYSSQVFFVPPWQEIYQIDNQRKETFQEAVAISNRIKEVYIELKYNLIEIPKCFIESRSDFILSELSSPKF